MWKKSLKSEYITDLEVVFVSCDADTITVKAHEDAEPVVLPWKDVTIAGYDFPRSIKSGTIISIDGPNELFFDNGLI